MRPSILTALAMLLASSAPALAEPPLPVRAIAVGPKLDLRSAETSQAFRSEIERLMTKARHDFATDRPNLVVFGGSWERLTAFLGPEHRAAREAQSVEEAYEALRQAHPWAFLWTKATHWGLSDRRALLLTIADGLYRPFVTTFAEAARRHHAYVLASTVTPDVDGLRPYQSMRTFPDRPVHAVGTGVYRKAFLFDPDGRLVGEVKQATLEASDRALDLTPGTVTYIHPFSLPFGKVGVALGPDATDPDYLARLDDEGCQILLQPATHAGTWADAGPSGDWQPKEWLDLALGALQASRSAHLQYTITPMPTGLFFDTLFDGQSAIMARGTEAPERLFVGVDPAEPVPGRRYQGVALALSPWVVEDPKFVHGSAGPATSLSDRREYLRTVARTLQRGGKRENQFLESVATADLAVR